MDGQQSFPRGDCQLGSDVLMNYVHWTNIAFSKHDPLMRELMIKFDLHKEQTTIKLYGYSDDDERRGRGWWRLFPMYQLYK